MRAGILSPRFPVESFIHVAEPGTNVKGLNARSREKGASMQGSSTIHHEHQETISLQGWDHISGNRDYLLRF